MSKENITRLSLDELTKIKGKTRPDAPEGPSLGANFWKNARMVHPGGPKKQLTMRLDADMLAWFKGQGKGYQTRMNAVLRSYYEAARQETKNG